MSYIAAPLRLIGPLLGNVWLKKSFSQLRKLCRIIKGGVDGQSIFSRPRVSAITLVSPPRWAKCAAGRQCLRFARGPVRQRKLINDFNSGRYGSAINDILDPDRTRDEAHPRTPCRLKMMMVKARVGDRRACTLPVPRNQPTLLPTSVAAPLRAFPASRRAISLRVSIAPSVAGQRGRA